MKAEILTLNQELTTQELCQQIENAMRDFRDECFMQVVKKESSILYCATLTNKKINLKEAETVYIALDLIRLYERDRDFLNETVINIIDPVIDDIQFIIESKRIHKLQKQVSLLEELIDTYI